MTKEQKNLVDRLHKECCVDIGYEMEFEQEKYTTIDDIMGLIVDKSRQIRVQCYVDAMKYLLENDPSLCESIEIAEMNCFSMDELNSKNLASLLKQRKMLRNARIFRDELENKFIK